MKNNAKKLFFFALFECSIYLCMRIPTSLTLRTKISKKMKILNRKVKKNSSAFFFISIINLLLSINAIFVQTKIMKVEFMFTLIQEASSYTTLQTPQLLPSQQQRIIQQM